MSIPKNIHYCWLGEKELPESAKKCIMSWKNILSIMKQLNGINQIMM
jgi:mannosyltransferase OCH1-like enzyme